MSRRSLRGDFAAAHVEGDQSHVLPTDTQKNTAFAYAKAHGVTSPEDYALALAGRLLEATPAADSCLVRVEEYAWDRIAVDGVGHDHAFVRRGGEVRTAEVEVTAQGASVVSGLTDLVVLKSTGSEFKGFLTDEYTTLPEAEDRILATSLTATWRYHDRASGRLGRVVRRGACPAARDVRDDLQPGPAGDALRHGTGGARGRTKESTRSRSRPPTSTTSSSTWRRSGSTTPARSSSPPTGPTA